MRLHDQFGLPLTVSTPDAVATWDAAVAAFLAHGAATPGRLGEALAADPDFALAQLAKGYFMLLLGRAELRAAGQSAHDAVAPRRAALTAREQAYLDGLALYLGGALGPAADRLDQQLAETPEDALLVKIVHLIRFVIGDSVGMRRSVESVLRAYGGDHPARGYILGCQAFALEETGAYLAAERAGRAAVAAAPDDAWGLHAVAHVMEMTNRSTEGVAWLKRRPEAWRHCNNFSFHIWWHLALFHINRGETQEALRLYDERIRAEQTDDYRDVANAASLLIRLELEEVDVGRRWEELADISAARATDGSVVFADLHYLLALGADGREDEAEVLIATLCRAAERGKGCMDKAAADAGVLAAAGLRAFARADYPLAFQRLSAARGGLQRVGGSHAQRDVFERVTIEAAIRAGLAPEARRVLQDRTRRRGALDGYAIDRLARLAAAAPASAIAAD